jgi:hypothetical protein
LCAKKTFKIIAIGERLLKKKKNPRQRKRDKHNQRSLRTQAQPRGKKQQEQQQQQQIKQNKTTQATSAEQQQQQQQKKKKRRKGKRLAKQKKKQSGALNPLLTPPSHIHKKDHTGVNLIVPRVVLLSFRCRDYETKKKKNTYFCLMCVELRTFKKSFHHFFDFVCL